MAINFNGYGFPNHCEIEYQEIKPSSEKIGLISLEKYSSFKNKSIDDINPYDLELLLIEYYLQH